MGTKHPRLFKMMYGIFAAACLVFLLSFSLYVAVGHDKNDMLKLVAMLGITVVLFSFITILTFKRNLLSPPVVIIHGVLGPWASGWVQIGSSRKRVLNAYSLTQTNAIRVSSSTSTDVSLACPS